MKIYFDKPSERDKNKNIIRGELVYQDVLFTFSVHAASKEEYNYVLKLNVISPESQKILQVSGKPRKDFEKKLKSKLSVAQGKMKELSDPEGISKLEKTIERLEGKLKSLRENKRLDELNASMEKYLKSNETRTVKKAIDEVVPKLYGKYREDIFKALKKVSLVTNLHSRTAFDMYQNDFFCRQRVVSEGHLQNKKGWLRNICDLLNHKPIAEITEADINKMVKQLKGKNVSHKINVAKDFFEYCGEVGAYTGANPFDKCVKKPPKGGDGTGGDPLYPKVVDYIENVYDERLHKILVDNLNDGMGLVIPLAKGWGMSLERMIEIKWKDFVIDGKNVRIQEYKQNFAGGTNNYIRPPSKETADLIIQKYKFLVEKYGKTRVKKMNVVEFEEELNKSQKKAKLTRYIRKTLLKAGVPIEQLRKAANQENPKAEGGAGLSLLKKHYEHSLQEQGGVKLNSGVGLYLRGMRIHDTTTDYYRCLSDQTGNHTLQVIMRRIDVGSEPAKNATISSALIKEDGRRKINVPAAGHDIKTGVITKKAIFIPKGTEIYFSSPNGVEGIASFHRQAKSRETMEFKNIY